MLASTWTTQRASSAPSSAYGAYLRLFWAHFSPEKEIAQASAMALCSQGSRLEHVVWPTLEDTRKWVPLSDDRMPTLMGKYKVPHFDARARPIRCSQTSACRRHSC